MTAGVQIKFDFMTNLADKFNPKFDQNSQIYRLRLKFARKI